MLTLQEIKENADRLQTSPHVKNNWYGLNTTNNFGCMTFLYRKYNYPKTVERFYDAYTSDTPSNNIKACGRSKQFLIEKTKELQKKDGNMYTLKEYACFIFKKLFIDTFNGCRMELKMKEYLEKKGYRCVSPSIYEDAKLGVDMFAVKDDELSFILQIKPISFFRGNSNQSLINDRIAALQKKELAEKKYEVDVKYCVYDGDNWVRNAKGGFTFNIDNYINMDGTIKKNIKYANFKQAQT